jgi:hypothetical protein
LVYSGERVVTTFQTVVNTATLAVFTFQLRGRERSVRESAVQTVM